jgi:hypothetical protein
LTAQTTSLSKEMADIAKAEVDLKAQGDTI